MKDWLINNVWNVLSLFFGVVGLLGIPSFWITLKYKTVKKLVYIVKETTVFRDFFNTIPEIKVTYKGYSKKLDSLTFSKFAFWSAGTVTVNRSDMVEGDRLRLQVDNDVQIISAVIVQASNPLNNFTIEKTDDRKCVYINFDYIDRNQGVVIQLAHTGDRHNAVAMLGTCKGIAYNAIPFSNARSSIQQKQLYVFDNEWSVFIIGLGFALYLYMYCCELQGPQMTSRIAIIGAIPLISVFVFLIYKIKSNYFFHEKLPDSLAKFLE